MSATIGYFDETILNDIRVTAASLMLDDRIKQQFKPDYDVVKAVQAVQTAKLDPLFSKSKKDRDVELIWENTCGVAVEDNTTCVIGGTKSSTNIETKTLSYEKVVNISVDEADFVDNEFGVEGAIAKLLLKADVEHANAFAQYVVAELNLYRGQNEYTTGKGTVVGLNTTIPAHYWDATLNAYFNMVSIRNKFTSPVLVSGENLYDANWVAAANAANADGKGDAVMYGSFKTYFDLFNIDTVNDPTLSTYMLSMNSLALAHKTFNPDAKQVVNNVFTRWTEASRFLPFKYDIFYDAECTTNDLIQHNFKIKLTADIFRNPIGCTELNHGILRFDCSAT